MSGTPDVADLLTLEQAARAAGRAADDALLDVRSAAGRLDSDSTRTGRLALWRACQAVVEKLVAAIEADGEYEIAAAQLGVLDDATATRIRAKRAERITQMEKLGRVAEDYLA